MLAFAAQSFGGEVLLKKIHEFSKEFASNSGRAERLTERLFEPFHKIQEEPPDRFKKGLMDFHSARVDASAADSIAR